MDEKKRGRGKYDTDICVKIPTEELKQFEEKYRKLEEKGLLPKTKFRSQRLRNWLGLWLDNKVQEHMMRDYIIVPEFIGGNNSIRFSYQVEQNRFFQIAPYLPL